MTPTEEQMKLKQKQIKEKAPPPGAAKILTRARKEQKKAHPQPSVVTQQNPQPATPKPQTPPQVNQQKAETQHEAKKPSTAQGQKPVKETPKAQQKDIQPENDEEWQSLLDDQNLGKNQNQ